MHPSLAGWSSGAGLLAVVATVTGGVHAHVLSIAPFASSGARVAAGRVWLLFSSALVIDRPVIVGLVAFGLIGYAALRLCGARTFWVAAVAGHVGSTLVVYAIIGLSRAADPHLFSVAVTSPDFGVSAMQGAWVGALATRAWMRRGQGLRSRAATVAAVCALAGVAWLLHPDPSILTFEHVFAFVIGAAVAWWGRGRARSATALLVPPLRRVGGVALARLRSAPVSIGYLLILCGTTAWLATQTDREVDRLLLGQSTNLDHLGRDPVRVIVTSAFWLSSSWRPLCVSALLLIALVAPLERRIGSACTAAVLAAGHVGATLLTAAGLWVALRLGAIAGSVAHARDVGPSYAIYAGAACLTYVLPARWRVPYLATVVGVVAFRGILSASFSDVGHLLSLAIGLACYPVVRAASPRVSPGARRASTAAEERERAPWSADVLA